MATFEEVIEFAARQLDERGLLLDRQIAQSANGDDSLLRMVRERLMAAGVAVDQYGIGLSRVGRSGACLDALNSGRLNSSVAISANSTENGDGIESVSTSAGSDWWVMTNGNIRGPWTIERLVVMRRRNELSASDLLRCGPRGAWMDLQEVAEIRDALVSDVSIEKSSAVIDTSQPLEGGPSSTEPESPRLDSLAVSNPQNILHTDPPARPTWLSNAPQRDDSRLKTTEDQLPLARVSETERPPAALTSGNPETLNQTATKARPAATSLGLPSGTASRSIATKVELAFRKLNWRQWTIDSITSTLSSVLPATFRRTFSSAGKEIRRRILLGILATTSIVCAWWFWPPSSRAIFNELEAVHRHVEELKLGRKSESQMIAALTEDRARVQRLADIMQQRATDQPSIHRELLLASKHALLVIIDHPRNSTEFDRMFARHMQRAKAILDGRPVEELKQELPLAPVPVSPSKLPDAVPKSATAIPGKR